MRLAYGRLLPTLLTIMLIVAIAARPRTAFEGALVGMDTWWNIVFPALLPFFIVSELILGLGLASFVGVLLEPVMRPAFNLPGSTSFAVAVGYSSGYPIGANFTAQLRSRGLCTRAEAEHLLTFTNNASPLFILTAVSVGMCNNPALGPFILTIHYLSNLALGFLFRGYRRRERWQAAVSTNLWKRAFYQFLTADSRHPGQILGDAVKSGVSKLMVIGGFIILFAVIVHLLSSFGLLQIFAGLLGFLLQPLGLKPDLYLPLATGIFEMTLGIKLVTEAPVPLIQQLIAVQLLLAWSGLSIQAQVASFISETDIRLPLYFLGRLAHAALAVALTLLLFPAFEGLLVSAVHTAITETDPSWTAVLQTSVIMALILPVIVLCFALCFHSVRQLLHVS